jgi:hypothetical protein
MSQLDVSTRRLCARHTVQLFLYHSMHEEYDTRCVLYAAHCALTTRVSDYTRIRH